MNPSGVSRAWLAIDAALLVGLGIGATLLVTGDDEPASSNDGPPSATPPEAPSTPLHASELIGMTPESFAQVLMEFDNVAETGARYLTPDYQLRRMSTGVELYRAADQHDPIGNDDGTASLEEVGDYLELIGGDPRFSASTAEKMFDRFFAPGKRGDSWHSSLDEDR